ncbi:MAG: tetratricopeptide repeat protein [Bacillota bacterium]|nr:tetratricopeptide repeat protein [Bacillota bacterium]
MDWSEQISRFEPLVVDEVPLFASPREMEQAIATYNKAIVNLHSDSQDIALIALRKLASSYPLFPQPAFLMGCYLAQTGNRKEAIEWIDQAILGGLPDDLHNDARKCQALLKTRPVIQTGDGLTAAADQSAKKPHVPVHASAVLEKTRRRGKVRMASEKERRNVLRRSEFPEEEQTNVRMSRDPVALVRLILPILAGALVVTTLVIAGIFWLPNIKLFKRQDNQDTARLSWLMDRLGQLSGENAAVASLLTDYQDRFDPVPTPEPTPEPTAEPTPEPTSETSVPQTTSQTETAITTASISPTAQPSPTEKPEPTPDPSVTALTDAASAYEQAIANVPDDLAQAALLLVQARTLLADIPDGTTATDVTGNAGQMREQVEGLIEEIAFSAARELRLLAEPEFKNELYEKALSFYLPAYEIYPRSYNGGVAYYIGRCYQLLGDFATARPYYEYVIEHFAGRDIARSAAFRLREMGY